MELLDRFGPLFEDYKGDSTWAILYSSLQQLHLLGMGLITAAFIGEFIGVPSSALHSSRAVQASRQ